MSRKDGAPAIMETGLSAVIGKHDTFLGGLIFLASHQINISWLVGNVLSSITILNLVRRHYDIPLNHFLQTVVTIYQVIFHSTLDHLVPTVLNPLPAWYKDLFVLSLVSCSLLVRLAMPLLRGYLGMVWRSEPVNEWRAERGVYDVEPRDNYRAFRRTLTVLFFLLAAYILGAISLLGIAIPLLSTMATMLIIVGYVITLPFRRGPSGTEWIAVLLAYGPLMYFASLVFVSTAVAVALYLN